MRGGDIFLVLKDIINIKNRSSSDATFGHIFTAFLPFVSIVLVFGIYPMCNPQCVPVLNKEIQLELKFISLQCTSSVPIPMVS